jgi:multidrug efflux system membrane fusion protein
MQVATVTSQVDGIVSAVSFREGQEVQSGQPLFQIEQAPYEAAFEQASSMLARDSTTLANAEVEAARYTDLEKQNNVTHEQAEQMRAAANAAAATVKADRAALAASRFNLSKTTVRAPISGRTGSLLVHLGNVVRAAGSTPMVNINQVRPILVRFAVPGSQLPLIQQYGSNSAFPVTASPALSAQGSPATTSAVTGTGQPAAPDPPGQAGNDPPRRGRGQRTGAGDPPAKAQAQQPSDAAGGVGPSVARGTLSFIDNTVDTTTGTIMLKAQFPNDDRHLWPGQFVSVSLQLYTEDNALVVPSQAVLTSQQGNYVYVVDTGGRAIQRPVRVERAAGPVTVIASGLADGDTVVVEGQSRITPGATVRVATGSDSAGAGGGGRGGRRRGGGGGGGAGGGGYGGGDQGKLGGGNGGGGGGGGRRNRGGGGAGGDSASRGGRSRSGGEG